MTSIPVAGGKGAAILSHRGGFSSFSFGGDVIRFATSVRPWAISAVKGHNSRKKEEIAYDSHTAPLAAMAALLLSVSGGFNFEAFSSYLGFEIDRD